MLPGSLVHYFAHKRELSYLTTLMYCTAVPSTHKVIILRFWLVTNSLPSTQMIRLVKSLCKLAFSLVSLIYPELISLQV